MYYFSFIAFTFFPWVLFTEVLMWLQLAQETFK